MDTVDRHKVLIVDDEKANIIALTHILYSEYVICAAKNGQDALEAASEYQPDVILLDILMPDMDGFEVLSHLKNNPETREIPVIFITGLDTPGDEEKGMALGAADYIAKPFSPEIVKLRVRNQMQILDQLNIINQRLRQQMLMAAVSQSFLSDSGTDELLTKMLHMVGEFMGIPQILLYELEEDEISFTCRNEWIESTYNLPTRIGEQLIMKEPMLSVIHGLASSRTGDLCLHSNDPSIKLAMAPYRKNFLHYIVTPIFIRGKVCAVLDYSREDDGRDWSESDINLAVHVAGILSGVYERSAMERQSSIVESSPQFIMYLSPNGELSYVNPAAAKLTGHTKSEIMAGGLGLLFGGEMARIFKNTYIPTTMKNGSGNFELKMTRKDGENRILAFTSFTAENGNIGAIARDITEIRALETELIKAKELAEQGSLAKSMFLSRMSHEMHTPMNAILGMTAIANKSDDPDKKAECIREIENASRHLLQLIDDVLDLSSLGKNTLILESLEFSFGAMLEDVLKMVRLYTEEKHQTLSRNVDPLVPDGLIGDKERLAQIMRNLLMNAVKFTPERGAIQMDVRMVGEEGASLVLEVTVSDNGVGIPKERQTDIFNSFEQADGGLARKFGGAGLGLAIVKQLVEMMGGRVWVESEPGIGSKFIFTVRLLRSGSTESGQDSADETTYIFKGKTALLVEDVEINREIMIAMLEGTQIEIDCAENGLEAVNMFQANPARYDIILMDINTPVMDGWEAARRIRNMDIPESKTIKIFAVTANTNYESIEESSKAGMNDYLGKPMDYNELLRKLNKCFK